MTAIRGPLLYARPYTTTELIAALKWREQNAHPASSLYDLSHRDLVDAYRAWRDR